MGNRVFVGAVRTVVEAGRNQVPDTVEALVDIAPRLFVDNTAVQKADLLLHTVETWGRLLVAVELQCLALLGPEKYQQPVVLPAELQ